LVFFWPGFVAVAAHDGESRVARERRVRGRPFAQAEDRAPAIADHAHVSADVAEAGGGRRVRHAAFGYCPDRSPRTARNPNCRPVCPALWEKKGEPWHRVQWAEIVIRSGATPAPMSRRAATARRSTGRGPSGRSSPSASWTSGPTS